MNDRTEKKRKPRARMQALLTNRMKRKLALVFALIVLALLGVSVRLAYINKTSGDKYTKKVLAQQDTNSTTLPYRRGDILDRNGTILATSEKVYNLILDPKVLWQNQDKEDAEKDCVEPTIKALVQYFELDESELRTTLSEKKDSSYVILRKQLSKDEIADFKAQTKKAFEIDSIGVMAVIVLCMVVISLALAVCFISCSNEGVYTNNPTFFDLFYNTIITFATVGYGDISPVSPVAKFMSIIISMTSILCLTVFISSVLSYKNE